MKKYSLRAEDPRSTIICDVPTLVSLHDWTIDQAIQYLIDGWNECPSGSNKWRRGSYVLSLRPLQYKRLVSACRKIIDRNNAARRIASM